MDGSVAKEDADGFDAGCDSLFYVFTAVDLYIDVVVEVHVVGSLGILAVGVPYTGVEGVGVCV